MHTTISITSIHFGYHDASTCSIPDTLHSSISCDCIPWGLKVGAFTSGHGGFELIAFGPVPPNESGGLPPPAGPPSPPPPPPPSWACYQFNSSDYAWIANCEKEGNSSGVCQSALCTLDHDRRWTHGSNANYTGCGTCWCCAPATVGPHLPRLPNINYDPGVFVMLREQAPAGGATNSSNRTRYFYASNTSTFELQGGSAAGAATYYAALLAVQRK